MDDSELGRLLGETAPPPAPSYEALHAIVERDRHRRGRTLAGGLVVALIVGLLAGVAINRTRAGEPAPRVAANAPEDDSSSTSESGGATEPAPSPAVAMYRSPGELARLFLRTTSDGVDIRAYQRTYPEQPPPPEPECAPPPPAPEPSPEPAEDSPDGSVSSGYACAQPYYGPGPELQAELSNEGAVMVSIGFHWKEDHEPTPTLTVLMSGPFGIEEQSPATHVLTRTEPEVTLVRVRWEDGHTDEMAPVEGFAVLARQGEVTKGTVEALDAQGEVVATASAEWEPPVPPDPPAECTESTRATDDGAEEVPVKCERPTG